MFSGLGFILSNFAYISSLAAVVCSFCSFSHVLISFSHTICVSFCLSVTLSSISFPSHPFNFFTISLSLSLSLSLEYKWIACYKTSATSHFVLSTRNSSSYPIVFVWFVQIVCSTQSKIYIQQSTSKWNLNRQKMHVTLLIRNGSTNCLTMWLVRNWML